MSEVQTAKYRGKSNIICINKKRISLNKIAGKMGRSASILSREIKRNPWDAFINPSFANLKANKRKYKSRKFQEIKDANFKKPTYPDKPSLKQQINLNILSFVCMNPVKYYLTFI